MSERGSAKAWVLAFVAIAGVGLGTLVGVGCAIGANSCPFRSQPKQTSTDGMTLFLANCAVCHGRDARGQRNAPSLVTGEAAKLTAEELAAKISKGKPLAGMPRFRGTLTPEQIRAVAEYLVSLREAA